MSNARTAVFGTAALIAVALLGACSSLPESGNASVAPENRGAAVAPVGENGYDYPSSPQPQGSSQSPRVNPPERISLTAQQVADLGTVLTDQNGFTLYRFDKDTAKPSVSNCDGDCAVKWPPVTTESTDIKLSGVDRALVGTVARNDGTMQVTVAGWPVYRFAQDSAPGDIKGQGVGGTWFAVTPEGKKAIKQPAQKAELALTTATVGNLGTVLTDKDGMTLYRFDKDTAKPSVSNCDGDCAVKWPPALVSSDNIAVQGVDKALVGTIIRKDGTRQLTIAGWPLYRFAEDKVCGEAKGQGVGGVWFVATPEGKKAGK